MPNAQSFVVGLLFLAAAIFVLSGAFSNWAWFWNNHRAAMLTRLIGKSGARALYITLGLLLTLIGGLATIGVIDMSKPPK